MSRDITWVPIRDDLLVDDRHPMAGKMPPPSRTAWTLGNVLAYAAVIGCGIAAWAVFKQYSWWETAAVVPGVVPFVAGQSQLDVGFGDLGEQINLWMHILDSAAVTAIALSRSQLGHTAALTRPARSPGLPQHGAYYEPTRPALLIDPAGSSRPA